MFHPTFAEQYVAQRLAERRSAAAGGRPRATAAPPGRPGMPRATAARPRRLWPEIDA